MRAAPLLFALLAALPAAAQEPSSAPLTLNITKDSYKSRIGLDYAVRWDFSDLASFRPRLGAIASGVKALASWDITENTRVNYYGFRTNPWRLIITKERKGSAQPAASQPAAGGVVTQQTPEYHKRVRLSVSPLVDDIKRNFDEGLRDFLLRSSLKKLSPEWEKAGDTGRKAFVQDVLTLKIWDVQASPVQDARAGLEYVGGGVKKNPDTVKQWTLPGN